MRLQEIKNIRVGGSVKFKSQNKDVEVAVMGKYPGDVVRLGIKAPKEISIHRDNMKKGKIPKYVLDNLQEGQEIRVKAYYVRPTVCGAYVIRLKMSDLVPDNDGQLMFVLDETIKEVIDQPVA